MAPAPASAGCSGSATTARKGVPPTSRSANTGHRRCSSSSTANTGIRLFCAVMHGPSPTVNCSRSASAAASELAPSGIRCCAPSTRLIPAPSTGSIRAQARASRTGSSSGPSRPASVTSASALSKVAAIVTVHGLPVRRPAHTPPAPRNGRLPDHVRVQRQAPEVRPYGDRALLVEGTDLAGVAAVRDALARDPLPGQLDLVPGARTVLVVLDRPPADTDVARLRRLRPEPLTGPDDAATVELPVVFDGPDLHDVADRTQRSVADLVATISGIEFTVA